MNKAKFNTEVFLIVVIALSSITASSIDKVFTNDTITLMIQSICLLILITASILTVYSHRHNEKRIIASVLNSIHKFFIRKQQILN
jgi:protein-S-isoprenylcysteine O-methyltransferase Ste14